MSWTPPPRPSWVERLNTIAVAAGGAENLVSLDRDALIEEACRSTGLDDFGDAGWRANFEALLPDDVLVLPSHGRPFRGAHRRIAWLRAHHDDRLALILSLLDRPRAAAEMIETLFPFDFDGHQLGFAMGEVIAHLNRLMHAGEVARADGDDGIIRYRRMR